MSASALPSEDRSPSRTEKVLPLPQGELHYTATAAWQSLAKRNTPVADIFYVSYVAHGGEADRPLTFVFNGGPGAASAYLHMGALGPKRIVFADGGRLPRPPVTVDHNLESWLPFTDLVFVDPIGTGFSRGKEQQQDAPKSPGDSPETSSSKSKGEEQPETPFWQVERDLKALGEFMQRFLSSQNRWRSPIFIAGESYGGFRVARLTRLLQQTFNISLSGAILISPVLEFSLLAGSDYGVMPWVTLLPSLAAAAAYHGRSQWEGAEGDYGAQLSAAEQFAYRELLPLLALGNATDAGERRAVFERLAALTGLPYDLVEGQGGRLSASFLRRELLRQQQQILGLYDASITAVDPFPDRPIYEGSDPTLDGIIHLFAGATNSYLREDLGTQTELIYELLNLEIFKAWQFELDGEAKQGYLGAVDDLRIGMTLNPHLRVYITHGWFDLVTPYGASNFLAAQLRLPPQIAANLTLQHFAGGHMFYTWDSSRQQWRDAMVHFYQKATR